ncbi:MAG: hypothetical protein CMH60_06645 [Myxococcales bacterium]|nr:hypothetical protein [Myxococcales bacterium]
MRQIGLAILLCASMGCGGGSASSNSVGAISWTFDYRDWTEDLSAAPADARTCSNTPATQVGPTYSAIDMVRVLVADPEGQVPGIDREFSCASGYDSAWVDLVGLVHQDYELTLEAKSASGAVLYRHGPSVVTLDGSLDETFNLQAATGELRFYPMVNNDTSFACPSGVETLRYSFYAMDEASNVAEETSLTGSMTACANGILEEVYIREIPSNPTAGNNDSYLPTSYKMVIEMLNSSDSVLHCGSSTRFISPGNSNLNQNENLSSGACN